MGVKKIIIGLIVIGAIFRWYNLSESMSFFYDQARDAIKAVGILHGAFVLSGPSTDTSGLFMGPLWYYLLAFLYFLARGSPVLVTMAVSLLDIATIPLFYLVGRWFFDRKTALFAAGLWAISAYAVAYARTLANPSTTVFWTLLFIYLFLKRHYLLSSLCFSLMFQLNPAAGFLVLPFAVWLFLTRAPRLGAILIFAVSFVPQIAFELRHQFIGFRSLTTALVGGGGGIVNTWVSHAIVGLQALSDFAFFGNAILSLALIVLGLWLMVRDQKIKEKALFFLWVILPIASYFFLYLRNESHPHYLLAWAPVVIFVMAYIFTFFLRRGWPAVLFVALVFWLLNLVGLNQEIIQKDHIAQPADPNKIGFNDEIAVVDAVYADAGGKMFGYHSYNITPYWADENWQYLFNWYGRERYGYVPERQTGDLIYVIYEPDPFFGSKIQEPWLAKFKTWHYQELNNFTNGLIKIRKFSRCEGECYNNP